MKSLEMPLSANLIGERVWRVPKYRQTGRSSEGVIVGLYRSLDSYGMMAVLPTHLTVHFDDDRQANCHPSALRLAPVQEKPPAFQSIEEADAWLERQAQLQA